METINVIEDSIIIFLQSLCSEGFISFLKVIANFGDEVMLVGVIGVFYWCIDKKFGLKLMLYIGLANIFYPMIKNAVKRPRPYMVNDKIQCLKAVREGDLYDISLQGYSFPSGHMVNSASIYGEIYKNYKNRILRIILIILVTLIALSRICLGVHYPSDVIVGLLIGIFSSFVLGKVLEKFNKKTVYLVLVLIGATGFLFCNSNDFYTGYGILLGTMVADFFEDKYVKFKETNNIFEMIIRLVGGAIVFFLLSKGSKLPFTEEFLTSKTTLAFLVRTLRYFFIVFISMSIYPMCFKYIKFKRGFIGNHSS